MAGDRRIYSLKAEGLSIMDLWLELFLPKQMFLEDFGEGSFDKGPYFRIPFNQFSRKNTRASYSTTLRSINRDGGRRLDDFGQTLWNDRRGLGFDALYRNKDRMRP